MDTHERGCITLQCSNIEGVMQPTSLVLSNRACAVFLGGESSRTCSTAVYSAIVAGSIEATADPRHRFACDTRTHTYMQLRMISTTRPNRAVLFVI